MDKLCSANKMRAVKLVRATMDEIAYFIHKNKDCISQIKVIHLLRDPRGRLNSLHECCNFDYTNPRPVLQMCERQMQDVVIAKQLEELYSGTFMEVQYEHLASATEGVSESIYNFLFNSKHPDEVDKWINTNRSKTSETTWNTNRKDSMATSLAWMKEISPKADKVIKEQCKELLHHLEH